MADDFVIQRACELSKYSNKAPELWEVDTLMDVLPQVLTRNPELLEQVSDFIRKIALTYSRRADSDPGDARRPVTGV